MTAAFKDPVILAAQCERAAKGIIIQYLFLADPYGSSQSVSTFLHWLSIIIIIIIVGIMED